MSISLDQFAQQLTDCSLLSVADVAALRDQWQPASSADFAQQLVDVGRLTPYQAQKTLAGDGQSLVFGNYLILDKIGQGGMGLVLKAMHRRMKRIVALKMLAPELTRTEEAAARFQREVQTAAKLSHPNIVTAHDADEVQGTHFLVMEYVAGTDLATLVRTQGPLPLNQAVDYILQAARGLEYAHRQKVIHRDIKPGNLLLDPEGQIKILDMGLARFEGDVEQQAELTRTGAVLGTVDFMSPEQSMNTRDADARSDIYSLGITFWYLLTGRAVYAGDSLMARMWAHREAPIPSLCGLRPDVSTELDAVFRRMLAKQPGDRQQTMAEVIAGLEMAGLPHASGSGSHPLFRSPTADAGSASGGTVEELLRPSGVTLVAGEAAAEAASGTVVAAAEVTLIDSGVAQSASPSAVTRQVPATEPIPAATGGGKAEPINRWRYWIAGAGLALAIAVAGLTWSLVSSRNSPRAAPPDVSLTVAQASPPTPVSSPPPPAAPVVPAAVPVQRGPFALQFDGVDDYVEIPGLTLDADGTHTVEAWVHYAGGAGNHAVCGLFGQNRNLQILRLNTGEWQGNMQSLRWGASYDHAPPPPFEEESMHVALVVTDDRPVLYLAGLRAGSVPFDAIRLTHAPGASFLGAVINDQGRIGSFFHGSIAAFRWSSGVRYVGERIVPPAKFRPDADTLALYDFQEGDGLQVHDLSGHGHHGRIAGAQWIPAPAIPEGFASNIDPPAIGGWVDLLTRADVEVQGDPAQVQRADERLRLADARTGTGRLTMFARTWQGEDVVARVRARLIGLKSGAEHPGLEIDLRRGPGGVGSIRTQLECLPAATRIQVSEARLADSDEKNIATLASTSGPKVSPGDEILLEVELRQGDLFVRWNGEPCLARTGLEMRTAGVGLNVLDSAWELQEWSVRRMSESAPEPPWLDLIPLIDPEQDKFAIADYTGLNQWSLQDGELRYTGDDKFGKLLFPVQILGTGVEWQIDYTRTAGDGALTTDIPSRNGVMPVQFDTGVPLQLGWRALAHVRVSRPHGTELWQTWVNGKLMYHGPGYADQLQGPKLEYNTAERTGLLVFPQSNYTFHRIRMRMLEGELKPVRLPPPPR